MRILDPVHKYIVFSEQERPLVDSIIFQRLRYIRQLGFAELAFPGAVHNRFLHSLGVCHLAGKAFDSLLLLDNFLTPSKKKDFRKLVRLSALLHDIGHGPLSHISETAMPLLSDLSLPFCNIDKKDDNKKKATHEHYTIKLILESEIKSLISAMDVSAQCVAHLIDDRVPFSDTDFFISAGVNFKPLLKQIISSDLDMDRVDYTRRDAFFCGADYGFCDHEWILNNLRVHIQEGQAFLGIGQKAVYSVESFFLGRRHLGLAIYFHNKMVAMDEMLYHYFVSPNCNFHIPADLDGYLKCTDTSLFENLREASSKNEWARRITEKKPYEKLYEIQYTLIEKEKKLDHLQKVKQLLKKQGISFIHTNSLNHVKRFYFQDTDQHLPLYIVDESTGKAVTLRARMKMFNQKEFMLLMDRIYVSPENKQEVSNLLKLCNNE